MGQHQPRVLQPELTPEQQIQIEGAWPPALFTGSIAAESLFQPLQRGQQRQGGAFHRWFMETLHQHHRIAVPGLIGRPTHGRGVVQIRPAKTELLIRPGQQLRLQQRPHRQQRLGGRSGGTLPVRPKGDRQG